MSNSTSHPNHDFEDIRSRNPTNIHALVARPETIIIVPQATPNKLKLREGQIRRYTLANGVDLCRGVARTDTVFPTTEISEHELTNEHIFGILV